MQVATSCGLSAGKGGRGALVTARLAMCAYLGEMVLRCCSTVMVKLPTYPASSPSSTRALEAHLRPGMDTETCGRPKG